MESLQNTPIQLPGVHTLGLLDTFRVIYQPEAFMRRLHHRLGAAFMVKGLGADLVLTGEPEYIRAIFSADPETFSPYGAELFSPLVGPNSVLLAGGPEHRARRRLLMPPFHGARMKAYGALIQDVALREASRWPVDQAFSFHEAMQRVSLEVIIRAVFGAQSEERVKRFEEAVVKTIDTARPTIMFVPALRRPLAGLGPWDRFIRSREQLSQLLFEEIDRRRDNPTPREDILSLLLEARDEQGHGLEPDQLRDELITLLVAGHETTATSLSWAMYHLTRQPEVLDQLRLEIQAAATTDPDHLARLPFLEAICLETLRIHTPAPLASRVLRRPLQLGPYLLPAGMGVGVAMSITHFDEARFPDPFAWQPSRFVDRQYGPFEFFPFGGGARRCLGAAFALYEMKLVLASLIMSYELLSADRRPPRTRRRNLVLGPDTRVLMRMKPRARA